MDVENDKRREILRVDDATKLKICEKLSIHTKMNGIERQVEFTLKKQRRQKQPTERQPHIYRHSFFDHQG